MYNQNTIINETLYHCIEEVVENDDGFSPGYFATKFYNELVELLIELLDKYPESLSRQMIQKKHQLEFQMIQKHLDPGEEINCYHYSGSNKKVLPGIVERYGIRIDYFDSNHPDSNMLGIYIVKLIKFVNIKCMDKIEGFFIYNGETNYIKPIEINYYNGKENGNYKKTKMQKEYLFELGQVLELEEKTK